MEAECKAVSPFVLVKGAVSSSSLMGHWEEQRPTRGLGLQNMHIVTNVTQYTRPSGWRPCMLMCITLMMLPSTQEAMQKVAGRLDWAQDTRNARSGVHLRTQRSYYVLRHMFTQYCGCDLLHER